MIDIHCHILAGIDDGATDIQESLEMAKVAAADGITKIVATPHLKHTIIPATEIQNRVTQLNSQLKELRVPVEILPGADISAHLDPSLLKEFTLNGSQYLLIEFPHTHIPRTAKNILFKLVISGFLPIITHPERNSSIIRNPDLLLQLLDDNIFIQITANSLTGKFGRKAKKCAIYLLEKGVVSFMASDAHSSNYRRPMLSKGLQIAEEIIGKAEAATLVFANPEAVIAGRPLQDLTTTPKRGGL
jgi:protein-tyrosine phosphatase